jgi:hypothetical protein
MQTQKSLASHQQHLLQQERLVFNFSITAHATPASKKLAVDIPGTVILRCEGLTTAADAVETITWTTPDDDATGDSIFGILINLGDNVADKIYSVTLTEVTAVSTSEVLTGPSAAAGFAAMLTDAGNIAIEVAATGLNLSSESPTFTCVVEYRAQA